MTTPSRSIPSLAAAPWLADPRCQAVFDALERDGNAARAVGGVVRNALMGLPVTDVDIATPATPADVIAACSKAGLHCVPTGIEHGTITVVSGHVPYEVTTLREDVTTDGRRATVAFTGDWAADASRRDFTVNALYCDRHGQVYDPLGGYPDVVARRIRFIGDAGRRIAEDYLRILRFFRFHATLGIGQPDRAGLEACAQGRAGLAVLSAERVRAELIKMLALPQAAVAMTAMSDWGLLTAVLHAAPRLGLFQNLLAAEQRTGSGADTVLRLSVLAIAVDDDIGLVTDRLRLSKAEREGMLVADRRLVALALDGDEAPARRLLYRLRPDGFRRHLLAALAVAPARDDLAALLGLAGRWELPRFPLRGSDLLQLGLPPGPRIGAMLSELEAWWIAQDFPPEADLRARLARIAAASR